MSALATDNESKMRKSRRLYVVKYPREASVVAAIVISAAYMLIMTNYEYCSRGSGSRIKLSDHTSIKQSTER